MQELYWLESHVGSIEQGIELINRFYWNLTVIQSGNDWYVKGGEKVLFRSDSREGLEAFLYGMALSYSVLPESYIERFREELDLTENDRSKPQTAG